jgi:hypothetical protein
MTLPLACDRSGEIAVVECLSRVRERYNPVISKRAIGSEETCHFELSVATSIPHSPLLLRPSLPSLPSQRCTSLPIPSSLSDLPHYILRRARRRSRFLPSRLKVPITLSRIPHLPLMRRNRLLNPILHWPVRFLRQSGNEQLVRQPASESAELERCTPRSRLRIPRRTSPGQPSEVHGIKYPLQSSPPGVPS